VPDAPGFVEGGHDDGHVGDVSHGAGVRVASGGVGSWLGR
jgi:hypothetical protein